MNDLLFNFPLERQLLESRLSQESSSRPVRTGRWWLSHSASGRTSRPRRPRSATAPDSWAGLAAARGGQPDHLHLFMLSLSGLRLAARRHHQQPVTDDVPGPPALVVHLSDLLLHEQAEDAAAASSQPPPRLRRYTCAGVWALSLQWPVRESADWSRVKGILGCKHQQLRKAVNVWCTRWETLDNFYFICCSFILFLFFWAKSLQDLVKST